MSINTIIVNDLVINRKLFREALGKFDDIEVICSAPDGKIALKKLGTNHVDLLFIAIQMKEDYTLNTLKYIKSKFPFICIVVTGVIDPNNSKILDEAFKLGIIDYIEKPEGRNFENNLLKITEKVNFTLQKVKKRLRIESSFKEKFSLSPQKKVVKSSELTNLTFDLPKRLSILAIGSSTGGPEALSKIIPRLPKTFPVPVVVVQHMPPKFTAKLAESLNKISDLEVIEGRDGERVVTGKVILAPGGKHMVLKKSKRDFLVVRITDGPPVNSCKPAVDPFFKSIAECFPYDGILSIILTGMGSDGLEGIREMKKNNCICITQSEATCVVFGMPKAVEEAGLSDLSLDLEEIAIKIMERIYINSMKKR